MKIGLYCFKCGREKTEVIHYKTLGKKCHEFESSLSKEELKEEDKKLAEKVALADRIMYSQTSRSSEILDEIHIELLARTEEDEK